MQCIVRDACAQLVRHGLHDALPEPGRADRRGIGKSHAVILDADHRAAAFVSRLQADADRPLAHRVGVFERVDHQLVYDDADGNGAVGIGLDRIGRQRQLREGVVLSGIPQILDQCVRY